jgi:hypothetical protein
MASDKQSLGPMANPTHTRFKSHRTLVDGLTVVIRVASDRMGTLFIRRTPPISARVGTTGVIRLWSMV